MRLISVSFLSVFFSCVQSPSDLNSKNNELVIIVKNAPKNWKYEDEQGRYSHKGKHEIELTKDGIIKEYFFPNYSKSSDTMKVLNFDGPIEIRHKFRGLGYFDYLVNSPDTLVFSYHNGKPYLTSLLGNNIINFDYLTDSIIHKGDLPNFIKYQSDFLFLFKEYGHPKSKEHFNIILELFQSKYKTLSLNDFEIEEFILDSLKGINEVSDLNYDYYKNRLIFKKKKLELNQLNEVDFNGLFQNDSLIKFSYYRAYLDAFIQKAIQSKTNEEKKVFDSLYFNKNLSSKSKKYLLFNRMESIINSSSAIDIKIYFEKFKFLNFDTKYITYLNEKYGLHDSISHELKLLDQFGNYTSFSKLLENNKGKIIYLDFWASWCAPCIKAMPFSEELRSRYKDDKIVFIYLALNDTKKKWEIASKKNNLSKYNNNYLIVNSKTNLTIEKLKIESLPRYLIFDKDSRLLYSNAPGPSDKEINDILFTLLKTEDSPAVLK